MQKKNIAPNIQIERKEDAAVPKSKSFEENKLTGNNKGFKMMERMGWTGGALGSESKGREDPVDVVLKTGRTGLGMESAVDVKIDAGHFRKYLTDYATDYGNVHELVFSADYTKFQRAELHKYGFVINLLS